MGFAFRIGNHFGFSDGADEDLQGYDANFGALLDELYPFRVIRLPYNILVATRPFGSFPIIRQGWKLMRRQSAGASITATPCFTDFCTFSKARTSIWRTRSRDTPNSAAKSSSVIGSSASRRASKMRRSRSLSTESASPSAFLRFSNCSLSASRDSWSDSSSTSQSCHSPESPSSRIGALSDTSPPRRRFMSTTSCSVTPSRLAMSLTWSGRRSPSSSAEILLLALRRLKNSFFWLAVVPIFTNDHERRMYSWIAALIHHMA